MYIVIDPNTGEVMTTLKSRDRIVRTESIEAFRQFETIPQNETFTKLYHAIIPILVECNLTAAELIIFMELATNLRYNSNVAKYPNGKLITRDNLQFDLNISESTIKRSVRTLVLNGLVVEGKTIEGNVFIVNPYIVMVGDKINKTVFDLFRKSKWARW